MKKEQIRIYYIIADLITLIIGWIIFSIVRYRIGAAECFATLRDFLFDTKTLTDIIPLVTFWMLIFYLSGYYNQTIGKSRLEEFFQTLFSIMLGTGGVFFLVILNDLPSEYQIYYQLIIYLFLIQFSCTYFCRLIITQTITKKIHRGQITQKCLVIGTGKQASKVTKEIQPPTYTLGYQVVGYLRTSCNTQTCKVDPDSIIGNLDDIDQIIPKLNIDEIIVAEDISDEQELLTILYGLYKYNTPIKLYLGKTRLLTGGIRVRTLAGTPLVDLTQSNFNDTEHNIKMFFDRIFAALGLILLSPLYLYLMIRVRIDSKGPVFFSQWRIGYRGKPFKIWKFRTMYCNQDTSNHHLATDTDPRITPFGKVMRKYRLDELPQLWNVLKGEMSFVGPRPEQKYYIEQIVKKAPYYYLLHNVRPGITSWGMVKYGYAATVPQMIERLQYDMLYYENMSLLIDLKIIIYTVKTVITGKGV